MLQFAPGVKVYLACKPVDMRRGFDGLAADVAQTLRADPYSGAAFVFRSKRGDYVKILTWDAPACVFSPSVWRKGDSSGRRSSRARCT
jgi:transposase